MTGKTCEARMIPLREKRMRPCGAPAKHEVNGRWLCTTHKNRAQRLAEQAATARAEREQP